MYTFLVPKQQKDIHGSLKTYLQRFGNFIRS